MTDDPLTIHSDEKKDGRKQRLTHTSKDTIKIKQTTFSFENYHPDTMPLKAAFHHLLLKLAYFGNRNPYMEI